MRPSQNLSLPPREYTPFQQLYATLPESTPPSQNAPDANQCRCNKFICATLPEFTTPSQNIPPSQQIHYYATLPESTPSSQKPPPHLNNYVRHSHNLPFPPRIYPPFQQLCATFPESTPSSQNIPPFQQLYVTFPKSTSPSQNKRPFSTNILLCDASRIYPPSQNTPPPHFNNYVRPSQPESTPPSQDIPPFQQLYVTLPESIPLPLRINAPSQQIYYYAMLPESTPPSQNTPPPISTTMCDTPRIYPSLPE